MSLLQPLLALLPLDRLPRTGWVIHGVPEAESISDHILSTCHLVLALGPRINPPLDTERALALAVVHDAPEALTGDLPRGARKRLPGRPAGSWTGARERPSWPPFPPWLSIATGSTWPARAVRRAS